MKENTCILNFKKVILPLILLLVLSSITTTASATSITKRVENKHLISIPISPIFITITVTTTDSYTGIYSNSKSKRNFTKHSETVIFNTINDHSLARQLKTSIGFLQFTSPSVQCNHIRCKCSFVTGSTKFSLRHYCSNTAISCTKGGSTSCKGGYLITGGVLPVSKVINFTGLAK